MSEFSDSYHLRSYNRNDGVNLLKKAKLKGFVFPETNGWITLVAEGDELMPNNKLIKVNNGNLIHFVNAEDYGLYFSIYNGNKRICHYECTWLEDIVINDEELNLDVLIEFIENNNTEEKIDRQELIRILHPQSFDEISEEPSVSSHIVNMFALENCDWISFNYVARDYFGDKELYPDLIFVE